MNPNLETPGIDPAPASFCASLTTGRSRPTAWFLAALFALAAACAAERPNIVLILADDLGAETLGCYGGTSYRTPHLDALARTGIRFENCFATPVCTPSRAELLTGRYTFRTGMTHITQVQRQKDANPFLDVRVHRTFANFLRDAGYNTSISGKWHLCEDFAENPTHVEDAGFDDRYLWRTFDQNKKVTRHYWNPVLWREGRSDEETGKGKFGDDLFSAHVLDFIRASRNRPFLVYYPMTLVHAQTSTKSSHPRTPATLKPGDDPDADGGPDGFAGLVHYMDTIVGRITAELEQLGLREKTLLLFAGDNGTFSRITSRYKGRVVKGGKASLSEAGTRVPLLASWPGTVPAGKVSDDLVDFTDFLATLLEAAGVSLPVDYRVDGRSFLPQLRGQQGQPREWVYRQLGEEWFVRGHRYRLDSKGGFMDLTNRYASEPAADSVEAAAARKKLQAAVDELRSGRSR